MINPGILSDRVVIKYPTAHTVDRFGQSIPTYASASIWAKVDRQSGTEVNANGFMTAEATYFFTVRKRDEITEKTMIEYDGKLYNVVFIGEPYKNTYRLTAERRKQ